MTLSRRFGLTLGAALALGLGAGGGWAIAQEHEHGKTEKQAVSEPRGDDTAAPVENQGTGENEGQATENETTAAEPAGDDATVSESEAAPATATEAEANFTG